MRYEAAPSEGGGGGGFSLFKLLSKKGRPAQDDATRLEQNPNPNPNSDPNPNPNPNRNRILNPHQDDATRLEQSQLERLSVEAMPSSLAGVSQLWLTMMLAPEETCRRAMPLLVQLHLRPAPHLDAATVRHETFTLTLTPTLTVTAHRSPLTLTLSP